MTTRSQSSNSADAADKLLTIPTHAGKEIVRAGAIISCPLLGTDQFVDFCRKRGLFVDRERLIRLERLGLFSPIFRVMTPRKKNALPFNIPIRKGNDWFTKRWARDTTSVPLAYTVPDHRDRTQEGYYSIFQIDYLHLVLQEMTLRVGLDSYLDCENRDSIDWQAKGGSWMQYADSEAQSLRSHAYRRSLALLCQFISNRYFPKTQGDQRMIQVGGGSYSDHWIIVNGHHWDWHEVVRRWAPQIAEKLFDLTPVKLRHAFETLAIAQESCDPLSSWYQLVQFISVPERAKLKKDALRAETLRAGAHMLRLLHQDLYGEELPHPNETTGIIYTHVPEQTVRQDVRRYLEFVANRFGVNPQPKLSLIVEGASEETAIHKIFEKYFGAHPGIYSIEIITLGGVDAATGTKEDRFRAILRLIDYLHHHQTFTFLILDNENYARKLKLEAQKAKSIHSDRRYVTRPEYIRVWKNSFEFDNFSCSEIAKAMSTVASGHATFTTAEVLACKNEKYPGSCLKRIYQGKARYDLPKLKLSEALVDQMLSSASRRKIENRPIIEALQRVTSLAARNPLPTMHESWEINQASKYLGKKIKTTKKRN